MNEASDDDHALSLRAAAEAKTKLAEARAMLRNVARELVGPSFWRYANNLSSGLQEYIEALSFVHYVECGGLVSYERVQANLCDDTGQHVGHPYCHHLSHRRVDDRESPLIYSSSYYRCQTIFLEYVTSQGS